MGVNDWRNAEFYYSKALNLAQESAVYLKRAQTREKRGDKCGSAGDLFSAVFLYSPEAERKFMDQYARRDTIIKCEADSFSIKIQNGKITVRQQTGYGMISLFETDTSFSPIRHFYLTGKDTIEVVTCPASTVVNNKIHEHLKANINMHQIIQRCGIGTMLSGTVYIQSDFDSNGKLINCYIRKSSGNNAMDAEALRVMKILPVLGPNDCSGKKTGYSFITPVRIVLQ